MQLTAMTPAELREWRTQAQLSQAGLAALLSVDHMTVSRWERNQREIPPYLEWALAGIRCFNEHQHATVKRHSPGLAASRG